LGGYLKTISNSHVSDRLYNKRMKNVLKIKWTNVKCLGNCFLLAVFLLVVIPKEV
jgi:hypothetical protein